MKRPRAEKSPETHGLTLLHRSRLVPWRVAAVTCIAACPNSSVFAAGYDDGKVEIFDANLFNCLSVSMCLPFTQQLPTMVRLDAIGQPSVSGHIASVLRMLSALHTPPSCRCYSYLCPAAHSWFRWQRDHQCSLGQSSRGDTLETVCIDIGRLTARTVMPAAATHSSDRLFRWCHLVSEACTQHQWQQQQHSRLDDTASSSMWRWQHKVVQCAC